MDVLIVARDINKAHKIFDPIFNGATERRRRESMGYVVRETPVNSEQTTPKVSYAQLDLTDAEFREHKLQNAVHGASLVFYLASARRDTWMERNNLQTVDHDGLALCATECNRADAHLVVLNPLFAWGSRLGPRYFYQNYIGSKKGYLRVCRKREELLLTQDGKRSPWLTSIGADNLRFTLFRVNHLVFPSFQAFHVLARNDNLLDPFSFLDVRSVGNGDLCARTFANLLMRALCVHRSSVEGRLDISGSASRATLGKTPIGSVTDVDAALQGLR